MTNHTPISVADTGTSTRRIVQLYETGKPVEAVSLVGRIYGLARVGIAASDTTMNMDLLDRGGLQELFEAIAQTADDLSSVLSDEACDRIKEMRAAAAPQAVAQ